MIKNKKWESLVWIVIWVFILSFVILWIANLLIQNTIVINTYEDKRDISIIKANTTNVIKNTDTSAIKENEIFYLYKNKTTKAFEVSTWSSNYKYIDRLWDNIDDVVAFNWNIYSRVLWVERDDDSIWEQHQIIRVSVRRLIKK